MVLFVSFPCQHYLVVLLGYDGSTNVSDQEDNKMKYESKPNLLNPPANNPPPKEERPSGEMHLAS